MFNPREEVVYRFRLAALYLREAERAHERGDWRLVVASSQLSVENAAKSIIAYFRVPSWSHDPSEELLDVSRMLPDDLKGLVEEIAQAAHELAPEHGRSTYGEPLRGLTPWDIYSKSDAERALSLARGCLEKARTVLRRLGIEV